MDPYAILGVTKTSSDKEIKQAHRKLIRQWHPDRNPGKEEECLTKSQEVNAAYDMIDTKAKRDELAMKESVENMRGFGQRQGFHTSDDPLADIFAEFQKARGGFHYQGQQQQIYTVNITLEEAYTGTSRNLNGHSFLIPRGIRTGNRLRLSNTEMARVNVLRHAKFQRSNDDLLINVQITAVEMMLGADILVTALNGKKYRLKIPEGTQPGQNVKIQGMGMPNPETDRYGDLFIRCDVLIPALTDEEKAHIMNVSHRQTINT